MDVAVIIPLFNGSRWIRRTLESVLAQTRPAAEVCVVDDGSEDDSPALARSFPGVTVRSHPDKGVNCARQFGLRHTTAPLVAFLDQDDLWHPDHLRLLADVLRRHPPCPAAFGRVFGFSSDDCPALPPAQAAETVDPWAAFPFNKLKASAAVIRRADLEAVGGWPTRFLGVGDLYTWLRLGDRGPLPRLGEHTVAFRQHDNSLSHDLRLRKAAEYLEHRRAALADALDHHLAANPRDADRLRRRLSAFTALADLLLALLGPDPSRAGEVASVLEGSLRGQGNELLQAAFEYVVWFLQPALRTAGPARRQALRETLLRDWPGEAGMTRKVLLTCLGPVEAPGSGPSP